MAHFRAPGSRFQGPEKGSFQYTKFSRAWIWPKLWPIWYTEMTPFRGPASNLFCSTIFFSKQKNKSDTFSICACHPCAGAMLIFSVSFQFLRMTSIKRFHHYGHQKVYLRPIVNTLLGYGHNREHVQKRGRAGIEPATSRTQSENHTTRPTAHSIAAKHARRDSNPQPPDSKSDALSVAPRALVHSWNLKQTQFH